MEKINQIIKEAINEYKKKKESFDWIIKQSGFVGPTITRIEADYFSEAAQKILIQIVLIKEDDELIEDFINSNCFHVREAMAKYGNKEICKILFNDKDKRIRKAVKKRLKEL